MFAPSEDVQEYIDYIHEYGIDDGGSECEKVFVKLNLPYFLFYFIFFCLEDVFMNFLYTF